MKSYWFWNGPDYKWAVVVYSWQKKRISPKYFTSPVPIDIGTAEKAVPTSPKER
jgi:hypothetical protein